MAVDHHTNTVASQMPSLKALLTTISSQNGSILLTFELTPLRLPRFDTKVLTLTLNFVP
jgi:hypothetical protein